MPISLTCSLCKKEIPIGTDYFEVMISVYEWNGESIVNIDSKDYEENHFCEDCIESEKNNLSSILYKILNKRNPDPDRIKKERDK